MRIFTSPSCHKCKVLKAFLEQEKIHHETIDINVNEEARTELIINKILSLPAVEKNGKYLASKDIFTRDDILIVDNLMKFIE